MNLALTKRMKHHGLKEEKITDALRNYCKTMRGHVGAVRKEGENGMDVGLGLHRSSAKHSFTLLSSRTGDIFVYSLMVAPHLLLGRDSPVPSWPHISPDCPKALHPPRYIGLVLLPPSRNYSFPSPFPPCALEFTLPCCFASVTPAFASPIRSSARSRLITPRTAGSALPALMPCPGHPLLAAACPITTTSLVVGILKKSL